MPYALWPTRVCEFLSFGVAPAWRIRCPLPHLYIQHRDRSPPARTKWFGFSNVSRKNSRQFQTHCSFFTWFQTWLLRISSAAVRHPVSPAPTATRLRSRHSQWQSPSDSPGSAKQCFRYIESNVILSGSSNPRKSLCCRLYDLQCRFEMQGPVCVTRPRKHTLVSSSTSDWYWGTWLREPSENTPCAPCRSSSHKDQLAVVGHCT